MKMVDLEHDDDFTSMADKANTNFKQMSWQFDRLLKKMINELRDALLKCIDITKQELVDINEQTSEEFYVELFVTIDKTVQDYIDLIEQTRIFLKDYVDQIKEELEELVEQTKQELQEIIEQAKQELEQKIQEVKNQIDSLKLPVGSYVIGSYPNYPSSSWSYEGYIDINNGSSTTSVSIYRRIY